MPRYERRYRAGAQRGAMRARRQEQPLLLKLIDLFHQAKQLTSELVVAGAASKVGE